METSKAVSKLLAGHPPQTLDWVEELRNLIHETLPNAEEEVKMGWRVIIYKGRKVVCAITPLGSGANLNFYKGTSLEDPQNLLEGTGVNLRHVKIRKDEDLNKAAIKGLLLEAWAVDEAAEEKDEPEERDDFSL